MARKSFVQRDMQNNDILNLTLQDQSTAPAVTDK
jgi:hypothetical protein